MLYEMSREGTFIETGSGLISGCLGPGVEAGIKCNGHEGTSVLM